MDTSQFQEQVSRFRRTADEAHEWSKSAAVIYEGIALELDEAVKFLEQAQRELETEREARVTAERNKERFRYALWVYLQEKDGLAGTSAPTPETLKLIRELLEKEQ